MAELLSGDEAEESVCGWSCGVDCWSGDPASATGEVLGLVVWLVGSCGCASLGAGADDADDSTAAGGAGAVSTVVSAILCRLCLAALRMDCAETGGGAAGMNE